MKIVDLGTISQDDLDHCDICKTNDFFEEFKYAGGFKTTILEAIQRADPINRYKLSLIYPNTVNLYIKTMERNG